MYMYVRVSVRAYACIHVCERERGRGVKREREREHVCEFAVLFVFYCLTTTATSNLHDIAVRQREG